MTDTPRTSSRPSRLALLCTVLGICSLSACSSLPAVNAWEKGDLAKPSMSFEGDPLDQRFNQHIYGSKENSSGGYGVGGGGCGCN
jgi:hypothetical protein